MGSRKGVPIIDALPEQYIYRDDGCEVSPSCLRCPLVRCKYDDPGWLHRERRTHRDEEVSRAREQEGFTVAQLAVHFAISERTVHRILQRSNPDQSGRHAVDHKEQP